MESWILSIKLKQDRHPHHTLLPNNILFGLPFLPFSWGHSNCLSLLATLPPGFCQFTASTASLLYACILLFQHLLNSVLFYYLFWSFLYYFQISQKRRYNWFVKVTTNRRSMTLQLSFAHAKPHFKPLTFLIPRHFPWSHQ